MPPEGRTQSKTLAKTKPRLGYTPCVGSLRFGSIQFVLYSNDHPPRHVHGFLDGTEVIVDLRADVRKILNAAAQHFEALANLWEKIHGNA